MINEGIKLKGELHILLVNQETGEVIRDETHENLIVTTGFGHITSRLIGAAQAVMSHMAIGSGSTAPAAANTALVTELARVALASATQVTTTLTNDAVQWVATFPAGTGTSATVQEAAVLNNSAGGTMFNRITFTAIPKGASDALTLTWKVTFA
jgi:hypothetical protein